MQYRTIKDTSVSLLGYGTMRLPKRSDGKIDREKASQLLDKAYDSGCTYFDTAYPYHQTESELFVGEWAKTHPRDSFNLTTKLPMWLINSKEDAEKMFSLQLERLQTDYFDFYLFHAIGEERWKKICDFGLLQWAQELKKKGKIRHIGFSFHDEYPVFEKIINAFDWDFCQIQLNYMDHDIQAGLKGLELARKKGIPVVIMEPVKGGMLSKVTNEALEKFKSIHPDWSPSQWALRWVESREGVAVVLSGMNSEKQLEENLSASSQVCPFNKEEEDAVLFSEKQFNERLKVACTGCQYCLPCPKKIEIPDIFSLYNKACMYDQKESMHNNYVNLEVDATSCVKCRRCAGQCPQHLDIPELLVKAHEYLK